MTFTSTNPGSVISSSGGSARDFQIRNQPDLSPASISGLIVAVSTSDGLRNLQFAGTSFKQTGGENPTGTYTYTKYSLVGAMVILRFSTPSDMARAVSYVGLAFASANEGTAISSYCDTPASSPSVETATFAITMGPSGLSTTVAPTLGNSAFDIMPDASKLHIQILDHQAVLTWPATGANYVLETADTPLPDASWSALTKGACRKGDYWILTNSISEAAVYYRLRTP